jgi:hypothetical protein
LGCERDLEVVAIVESRGTHQYVEGLNWGLVLSVGYEDCKRQGLVCNLGPGRGLDRYVAVEKIRTGIFCRPVHKLMMVR